MKIKKYTGLNRKHSKEATEPFIIGIRVRRLFGQFNYTLDLRRRETQTERLSILYGDNGSGKTTILRLVFHLLSPVDNRGHKTILAQTKFASFEVYLADGSVVRAERPPGRLVGTYELTYEKDGDVWSQQELKVSEDGSIKMSGTPEESNVQKLLQHLANLKIEVLFMRDDRSLTSNLDQTKSANLDIPADDASVFEVARIAATKRVPSRHDLALASAIDNVTAFFRHHALAASSQGETDTNKVYGELIKHLILPKKKSRHDKATQFQSYMMKLEALAERNESFVSVGLTTPLFASDMIASLRKAKREAQPELLNVLTPYIDGGQAKLDALESIRKTIYQFTDSLNSFIANGKKVVFELQGGLRILGYDGEPLEAQLLSSGEKQLLSMFCNIICMRNRTSIFIIDEPELSLNVKWQRRLVQSLLDCTEGSSIQFLLASHSMELLARHRASVVQLASEE